MNTLSRLIATNKTGSNSSDGKVAASTPSKYASSSGIMTKGSIISTLRTEANTKIPIDCPKYFTSLSRICANAEFGEVIIRKIIFRSKEDKQNKYRYFVMFISIVIILSE